MNILMAAGGTGGHIYPGIAISEQLKKTFPDAKITFVGSYVGMEKDIVPQAGYDIEFIRARGFEKGFSKETLEAVKGIFDSLKDARKLLKKYKPDLVIGTGGFTSATLLFLASMMKIPTMIHEQNAYPGRSNRLTGHFVDRIAISFPQAAEYFKGAQIFLAGNPVRDEFKHIDREAARKKLGIAEDEHLIIFMGGSQGAQSINEAALYVLKNINRDKLVFYHLTGKDQYEIIKKELEDANILDDNIHLHGYYTDVATLLSAGDLVVSRSGAMSVAEISACGIPSILIPYPQAAGDHQSFNARVLSENGAAVLIPDDKLTGEKLLSQIEQIIGDQEKCEQMRKAAYGQRLTDADERFCREAFNLVFKYQNT